MATKHLWSHLCVKRIDKTKLYWVKFWRNRKFHQELMKGNPHTKNKSGENIDDLICNPSSFPGRHKFSMEIIKVMISLISLSLLIFSVFCKPCHSSYLSSILVVARSYFSRMWGKCVSSSQAEPHPSTRARSFPVPRGSTPIWHWFCSEKSLLYYDEKRWIVNILHCFDNKLKVYIDYHKANKILFQDDLFWKYIQISNRHLWILSLFNRLSKNTFSPQKSLTYIFLR